MSSRLDDSPRHQDARAVPRLVCDREPGRAWRIEEDGADVGVTRVDLAKHYRRRRRCAVRRGRDPVVAASQDCNSKQADHHANAVHVTSYLSSTSQRLAVDSECAGGGLLARLRALGYQPCPRSLELDLEGAPRHDRPALTGTTACSVVHARKETVRIRRAGVGAAGRPAGEAPRGPRAGGRPRVRPVPVGVRLTVARTAQVPRVRRVVPAAAGRRQGPSRRCGGSVPVAAARDEQRSEKYGSGHPNRPHGSSRSTEVSVVTWSNGCQGVDCSQKKRRSCDRPDTVGWRSSGLRLPPDLHRHCAPRLIPGPELTPKIAAPTVGHVTRRYAARVVAVGTDGRPGESAGDLNRHVTRRRRPVAERTRSPAVGRSSRGHSARERPTAADGSERETARDGNGGRAVAPTPAVRVSGTSKRARVGVIGGANSGEGEAAWNGYGHCAVGSPAVRTTIYGR